MLTSREAHLYFYLEFKVILKTRILQMQHNTMIIQPLNIQIRTLYIYYQLSTSDSSNPLQHEHFSIHFCYENASQKKSIKHEERRQGAGRDDGSGGTEVKDYIEINCRFYIHLVILLFRKQTLIKNVSVFDTMGLKY
jgi:hypothetical protein